MHAPSILLSAALFFAAALYSNPAQAHTGPVGVVQARLTSEGVEVLLKFKADLLLAKAVPDAPEGATADLLTTPKGRNAVLDLLSKTHTVTRPNALCERDTIDLWKPTPSGKWFDILIKYRCPTSNTGATTVRVATLLDEASHRWMGHFEQNGEVVERALTVRRPFYTFDEAPPEPEPPPEPPPTPPAPGWLVLLAHVQILLLPGLFLCAPGSPRVRVAAAVAGPLVALGVFLMASGAPSYAGIASLAAICAIAVRHGLLDTDVQAADIGLAALAGAFAGLDMVAVEGFEAMHWAALGTGMVVLSGLGAWVGWSDSPRGRRAVAWFSLVVVVALGVGEVAALGA